TNLTRAGPYALYEQYQEREKISSSPSAFRKQIGILSEPIVIENISAKVNRIKNEWSNIIKRNKYRITLETDLLIHETCTLKAIAKWRKTKEEKWQETKMQDKGYHVFSGIFAIKGNPEDYEYTIEAWLDAGETWRNNIMKRAKGAPHEVKDIYSDTLEGIKLLGRISADYNLSGRAQKRIERYMRNFKKLNGLIGPDAGSANKEAYAKSILGILENAKFIKLINRFPLKNFRMRYEDYEAPIKINKEGKVKLDKEFTWIGNITPVVNGGRYAVKTIVGEEFKVEADILVQNPKSVILKYRRKLVDDNWQKADMKVIGKEGKRWQASFIPQEVSRYEYSFQVVDGESRMFEYEKEAQPLELMVNREKSKFGTWYEYFPRSFGGFKVKNKEVIENLNRIKEMGFDIVYVPPIHPIGRTKRKGKNNSLTAKPGEPGSPWAIGDAETTKQNPPAEGDGGHRSVEPSLGTLEDFRAYVKAAKERGLEIAPDLTFQCSPDHPYLQHHPEWFYKRPDGSIKYAENPPKKYEDVYPINQFPDKDEDMQAIWNELKDVVEFWINQGIHIFRVDNPHKKPIRFWKWLFDETHKKHPDVIFLAEAFTDPKMMRALAKAGFQLSYSYYPWKNTKAELLQYTKAKSEGIVSEESASYLRAIAYINTPDILPDFLKDAKPQLFKMRYALAATLAPSMGIYGPVFELGFNKQMEKGSTDYLDNEKYETYNWKKILEEQANSKNNITGFIKQINKLRHEHLALQQDEIEFIDTKDENLVAYIKKTSDNSDVLIVVVNIDPKGNQHSATITLPLKNLGIKGKKYILEDLLTGKIYQKKRSLKVKLDSSETKGPIVQIFSLRQPSFLIQELNNTINPDVNKLLSGNTFAPSTKLGNLNNPGIRQVLVDKEAETILSKQPSIEDKLKQTAKEISLEQPGSMHFKVFESDQIKAQQLTTYLASDKEGKKILLIAGSEQTRKLFEKLHNIKVGVITTEMGFGISGYGGIGTYMATLLPYLSEYYNVVELGWDDNGTSLKGKELTLSEYLTLKDQANADKYKHLNTLSFYGVKKDKVKGYETVRQAKALAEDMVRYLANNHPDTKLVYIQTWYNGGATPLIKELLPNAAIAAIFHSVQPGKHWKAGDLGGAVGQREANHFESNYASLTDGIIGMTNGNAKEAEQFYSENNVRLNQDHFDWLASNAVLAEGRGLASNAVLAEGRGLESNAVLAEGRGLESNAVLAEGRGLASNAVLAEGRGLAAKGAPALIEELTRKGYLIPEGTTLRLTEAYEAKRTSYNKWYNALLTEAEKEGFAKDGMLTPKATDQEKEAFEQFKASFTKNNPRPELELASAFAKYEEGILQLTDYPRHSNIAAKTKIIYHSIPGEVTDIPSIDKNASIAILEKYLDKYQDKNPGKVESLRAMLKEALAGKRSILTYVGRLAGQKGLRILIDSLKDTKYLDPSKYLLVLVATSPDSPDMQLLADKDVPQHPNILWIPEHIKDQKAIDAIRTGSDVILVPSTNEPFGLVIVEAWRAKVPVVSLKHSGGPDELIRDIREYPLDKANGALADKQNADELAKAIAALLNLKPSDMQKVKGSSFKIFKNEFTLRHSTAPRTYEFFEELMAGREGAVEAEDVNKTMLKAFSEESKVAGLGDRLPKNETFVLPQGVPATFDINGRAGTSAMQAVAEQASVAASPAFLSLEDLKKSFELSTSAMQQIISSFKEDMKLGLSGKDGVSANESSLAMLSTFVDNPTGKEKGKFLALDLGGTNFRVLMVDLKGDGSKPALTIEKFKLSHEHITGTQEVLFDAIAEFVKQFLNKHNLTETYDLGFTFSFPVNQIDIDKGISTMMSKGFTVKGIVGEDVVAL
ncbi:MAG: maltotransferase domain-containing protein, partial [Candidatus Omnitrophota bacterium]